MPVTPYAWKFAFHAYWVINRVACVIEGSPTLLATEMYLQFRVRFLAVRANNLVHSQPVPIPCGSGRGPLQPTLPLEGQPPFSRLARFLLTGQFRTGRPQICLNHGELHCRQSARLAFLGREVRCVA